MAASIEQLEQEKAELAEQEAEMCQQVQRENPEDVELQRNAYYHPKVREISDRLRAKIAEWHAALPDDHPEFVARGSHPQWVREQADVLIRAAIDRLHERGEIEKAQHTALHKSVSRTVAVAKQHHFALTGEKED